MAADIQIQKPSPVADAVKARLVDVIRFLHARNWTPATSSNFSCKSEPAAEHFFISCSGLDKGLLTPDDFLEVDAQGSLVLSPREGLRPSAETLLHALVYRLYPGTGAVLHTHSVNGTVLSKLYETQGGLWLQDFEILKGFEGIKTHEVRVWVPIFSNMQDMQALSRIVQAELARWAPCYGFLLVGHGLYAWGETPEQAKRHLEVFEFLFEAILKLKSHGYPDYSG
ncbi:MAG TPA: methylthioribulose 1-phosphate dehydratase [Oculatellaceae cyanobacterium]